MLMELDLDSRKDLRLKDGTNFWTSNYIIAYYLFKQNFNETAIYN